MTNEEKELKLEESLWAAKIEIESILSKYKVEIGNDEGIFNVKAKLVTGSHEIFKQTDIVNRGRIWA